MTNRVNKNGLQVDAALADFLDAEVLSAFKPSLDAFWGGFKSLVDRFSPLNRELLNKRESLQQQVDAWHLARAGQPINMKE